MFFSALVEHINYTHNEDVGNSKCCGFRISVKETHTNAMNRQITEATKIDQSDKPTMNRKVGYRTNNVLRLKSSITSNDTPFWISASGRPNIRHEEASRRGDTSL